MAGWEMEDYRALKTIARPRYFNDHFWHYDIEAQVSSTFGGTVPYILSGKLV